MSYKITAFMALWTTCNVHVLIYPCTHESAVLYESNDHKHELTACQQRYFRSCCCCLSRMVVEDIFLRTMQLRKWIQAFCNLVSLRNVQNEFRNVTKLFAIFSLFFNFPQHMLETIQVAHIRHLFTMELNSGYFVRHDNKNQWENCIK